MGALGRRGLLLLLMAGGILLAVAAPASGSLALAGMWGSQGAGPGEFEGPEGIAAGPGVVYVADSQNDRIQKFDSVGTFLTTWGFYGTSGDGRFSRPAGVAVDFAGNVYVVDTGNNRIQKFDANGTFLTKWGSFGTADGRFNGPIGIDTDATGNVYVADSGNDRIQKFDSAGSFVLKFGTTGTGNSQFRGPTDVAVDSVGDVYVTDSFNYRVKKFTPLGAFVTAWGSQGSAPGAFNHPHGIEVDAADNVLVSDANNHRVQQFTQTGSFVDSTGSQGSGPGQFQFPAGVGSDPSGNVVVADSGNNRVQRFRTGGTIIALKDAVPDDPQDFDFTAGGGLTPASFQLDDDGNNANGLSNARAFFADPGSGYSLAETVPASWDLTSATCSDGSPPSNIDVVSGEVVTCTFSNRKRGQIVVVQDSQPDDPQDFDFTAGGGLSPASFQLDDDGDNGNDLSNTRVFADVVPGSGYSLSQTTPGGWLSADVTCSDGSSPSNIDVAPGEVVTCTFENLNSTAGKIRVVKDSQPDDPQDFSFTGGGDVASSFQLDDDGSTVNGLSNTRSFIVTVGAGHSVAETTPAGWYLDSATCSDGSPVSNIDVSSGETVTCTFTNLKRGRIVVVKDSQPNDAQDFSFTAGGGLSPASFQLDDDSNATLSNTQEFDNLVPGSGYSVSEDAPPANWDLTSATCSDGSSPANVDVGAGETVTCTFTNTKRGQIIIGKNATPDDPQDFSFTTGGGLSPGSFQLDDDGDELNVLASTRVFANVVPGSGYSVAETTPAGWDLTSTACSDGSSVSNIGVSPGETVTCTFNNRKRGNIVVLLNAQPDDPQDFNFTTGGGLSPSSFQLDDDGDTGNGLSNTRTFANLTPGSNYGVAANTTPGWLQEQVTCDDGSPPSNISVSAGETVTCSFLMTQNARIVVVKDAQPNDAQDFSFTAGGGLSPASFQLDDDGSDTNGLSNRHEFIVAPSSGYSVAESPPPVGWVATGSSCTDGSPVSNIDASAGETVTCTFVNLGQNYVRPKGATPFAVDLVPTYNTCTAPNRTHGPPLAFPSCNPPVQTSTAVTVGSPDANGAAANAEGNVRFDVVWTPGPPDDTDVTINSSIVDVRCKAGTTTCGNANAADGADYTGQLQGNVILRLTDRDSSGGEPNTVVDIPLPWPSTCAVTPNTAIGGTCVSNTSFDAIVPGMVREGKRAIWGLNQVQITDGGPDGQTGTAPNGLFMAQGVFVP